MKHAITVKYEEGIVEPKIELVEVPTDKTNLEFFYEQIGCKLVELVYMDGFDIWINEEGLYDSGSPVYGYGNPPAQLAGNLVITNGSDGQGETLFFDKDEDFIHIASIINLIKDAKFLGFVR